MTNVLWILPDNITRPTGGMGIYAQNMYRTIKRLFGDQINISILSKDNITKSIETGVQDNISLTFLGQSDIIEDALLLNKEFDIIHACDWGTAHAGQILARIFNAQLIYHIHLNINHSFNEAPSTLSEKNMVKLIEDIELTIMNKSNTIIHVSYYYANIYPKIFKNKSITIHNGINTDEWTSTINNIELPGNNEVKCVYIGRFTRMKNIKSILDSKIPDNMDMIFIGSLAGSDSDLMDIIKTKSDEEDNFHFVGPLYGQEKINFLNKADCILMPSIYEPFGIVALEAMASRSLLLCSMQGGLKEFVPEKYSINCGTTSETITEALEKVMLMKKTEIEFMTNNAYEHVKNYTWDEQAKKLASIYYYLYKRRES